MNRQHPPVPAPHRQVGPEAVQVTCQGVGTPPLPVLARVSHVLSGADLDEVWAMLRQQLAADAISADELVLLRAGRGADEAWIEVRVLGDQADRRY